MSNSSARRPQPASSGAQLSNASSASSRDEMTPISSPVSCFTRARNAPPLAARRHASVAMARSRRTGRRSSRDAQACKRRQRPLHGFGAELAGAVQPLAQPDDAAEAVEHAEPVARWRCHQHAAVVGAEVERGKCRAGKPPRLAERAPGSIEDWTFRGCITALSSAPACLGKRRHRGCLDFIWARRVRCQGDRSWTPRPTPRSLRTCPAGRCGGSSTATA